MKIYTLLHMADWESSVVVFTSETDLWETIKSDAEDAAERSEESLPNDPADWPQFIYDNGWKVQVYEYETRDLTPVDDVPYDMTPAVRVVCGTCGKPIRHDDGDPADSWIADDGGYACGNGLDDGTADHKPSNPNETEK